MSFSNSYLCKESSTFLLPHSFPVFKNKKQRTSSSKACKCLNKKNVSVICLETTVEVQGEKTSDCASKAKWQKLHDKNLSHTFRTNLAMLCVFSHKK